jgi:hypothetical protein
MTDELLVPIVSTSTRVHLSAEDDRSGMASIEVMVTAPRTIVVQVTPDDDDVTVELRVRPR